jgi:O-antigen/teichoic acid export membrane protein
MWQIIKDLIFEHKESHFFKNIFLLVSGTAVAQIIPIALQPILRRLYSPEDFGALAIYLTIVSILSVFCSLRYEQAIVIPKSNNVAANVLVLSVLFSTFFCCITLISIILFHEKLAILIKFPHNYVKWLFVIPFSVFFVASYEALNYWLIRNKAFRASSINKVSRRAFEGIAQISFGLNKSSLGLFLGDITGNLANVISGVYQALKHGFDLTSISKLKLKYSLKKYIEFPKYNLFPNLLNTISSALPIFFINDLYSKATVGHFDLSRQILSIPAALITASIFQVLYQKVSETKNLNLSIKGEVVSLFLILSVISILEIIVIFFFGVFLFKLLFGTQWSLSGEYSRLLVFSYAIKFIVSPLSAVFIPLGKIKIVAAWQIFYFLIMCSFFFMSNIPFSKFLRYYIYIDIFSYLFYFSLIAYVIKEYEKNLVREVGLEYNNDDRSSPQ